MKRLLLLVLLLTGGCGFDPDTSRLRAAAHHDVTRRIDPWGYVQPIECRQDLSKVPGTVIYMADDHPLFHPKGGPRRQAITYKAMPVSVISEGVHPEDRGMVEHHEACHRKVGDWHPDIK